MRRQIRSRIIAAITLALTSVMFSTLATANEDGTAAASELYELRTYTTNEGKLDNLHARFRNHTMRIFENHGMRNVAYWIPADKPNTLMYIVAHADGEAAKANWQAFVADPEWKKVYAASIEDGALVANIENTFMTKTDYSP